LPDEIVKEIKSKEGTVHFRRWRLLATPWFSVFVHGIYRKDEEAHMHNHPWNFFSLVLCGGFTEQRHDGVFIRRTWLKGRYNRAEDFHRIFSLDNDKPCYTLVVVGQERNEPWGFDTEPFTDHATYRLNKKLAADK
jgi:hypothetical protein